MTSLRFKARFALLGIFVVVIGVAGWQGSLALADMSAAPTPNPLALSAIAITSPLPDVDITGAGPASAIQGDPQAGATKFRANCASCHGDRGMVGIANPGSNDGVVPTLNPIDPGFLQDSNGDPAIFAHDIDLFVQHGSRPAGKQPLVSMPGLGDHKMLPQKDIADIEAYVMALNGVVWPNRCPGVELNLGNPSPGSRVEVGSYVVEGRSFDVRAQKGAGVDRIDFFLDDRDSGGRFVGTTTTGTPAGGTDAAHFRATLSLPNLPGGHTLIAYAYSAVRGQVAVVSVPIAIGEDAATAGLSNATSLTLACSF